MYQSPDMLRKWSNYRDLSCYFPRFQDWAKGLITKCISFIGTLFCFQSLELEVSRVQAKVTETTDEGRQLAHEIDMADHDKAIRIYRQVEDMKVSCSLVLLIHGYINAGRTIVIPSASLSSASLLLLLSLDKNFNLKKTFNLSFHTH